MPFFIVGDYGIDVCADAGLLLTFNVTGHHGYHMREIKTPQKFVTFPKFTMRSHDGFHRVLHHDLTWKIKRGKLYIHHTNM